MVATLARRRHRTRCSAATCRGERPDVADLLDDWASDRHTTAEGLVGLATRFFELCWPPRDSDHDLLAAPIVHAHSSGERTVPSDDQEAADRRLRDRFVAVRHTDDQLAPGCRGGCLAWVVGALGRDRFRPTARGVAAIRAGAVSAPALPAGQARPLLSEQSRGCSPGSGDSLGVSAGLLAGVFLVPPGRGGRPCRLPVRGGLGDRRRGAAAVAMGTEIGISVGTPAKCRVSPAHAGVRHYPG